MINHHAPIAILGTHPKEAVKFFPLGLLIGLWIIVEGTHLLTLIDI